MDDEVFDAFDAPQLLDFSKDDSKENVDAFFDAHHGNESKYGKSSMYDEFYSPVSPAANSSNEENSLKHPVYKMRKSMSVGNLIMFSEEDYQKEYLLNLNKISEDVKSLDISIHEGNSKETDEKIENEITQLSDKPYFYRNDSQISSNKGSQSNLSKLSQPKYYCSVENLKQSQTRKFVSLAEAVFQFQSRTPVRFRSKPNLHHEPSQPPTRTVPESPKFQSRTRNKNCQQILSREEREKIELENIKRFKIKANPVNKKILQGPVKPMVPIEKKKCTKPEPFSLTAAPPKKAISSPPKYTFHARPAPRSAEKQRKPLEHEQRKFTEAITPTFMKNYQPPNHKLRADDQKRTTGHIDKPMKPTKPEPFSFEIRDQMVKKKREMLIQKIKDEERRAREFHAKPLPKSIYQGKNSSQNEIQRSECSSTKSNQNSTENISAQFKAKPPVVLYKEPFVPAKAEKPPTQPVPFNLSSEQRSHEREEFERERKLKEIKLENIKRLQEEERLKLEQEEIARLRKETEYKAQPIKKYKGVIVQPSGKVTEPISPKFYLNRIKATKNKENVPDN